MLVSLVHIKADLSVSVTFNGPVVLCFVLEVSTNVEICSMLIVFLSVVSSLVCVSSVSPKLVVLKCVSLIELVLLSGPESRYPSLDFTAVGPSPLMISSSTISQYWSAPTSSPISNDVSSVTARAILSFANTATSLQFQCSLKWCGDFRYNQNIDWYFVAIDSLYLHCCCV